MTMNVHPETGIPYGVIDARNVQHLWDAIINHGTNERIHDRDEDISDTIRDLLKDRIPEKEIIDVIDDIIVRVAEAEGHGDDSEDPYRYTDKDGNEFRLSFLGGAPLIWCIKTDTVASASICSPCVPNAGNLDSPSEHGIACYGVPKHYVKED